MRCPYCNNLETSVIDSRNKEDNSIKRRRSCDKCKKRWTTYERIESINVLIIKKDGTREAYNRDKLKSGIIKSCSKRKISMEDINSLINDIKSEMFSYGNEIPSNIIGEIVLNKLKKIDKVAYIRFASVYRDFKEVDDFNNETKKIN